MIEPSAKGWLLGFNNILNDLMIEPSAKAWLLGFNNILNDLMIEPDAKGWLLGFNVASLTVMLTVQYCLNIRIE